MRRLVLAAALFAMCGPATAATVTFNLGTIFTGNTPAAPGPWITASFSDIGADLVQLTITRNVAGTTGMSSGEFIRDFYFNTTRANGAIGLTVSRTGGPVESAISLTSNGEGPGGPGGSGFDAKIAFGTANNANRFDQDWASSVFSISGTGINANTFDAFNASGRQIASHIQGLPNGGSSKITETVTLVPLPAGAVLGLAGLGLVGIRRRR